MLFLIEKDGVQDIVAEYDLSWRLSEEWKIVKPLFDAPNSVSHMRVGERSPKQIMAWYNYKIEMLERKLGQYRKELQRFKDMVEK